MAPFWGQPEGPGPLWRETRRSECDDGLGAGSVSGGCVEDDLIYKIRDESLAVDRPQVVIYAVHITNRSIQPEITILAACRAQVCDSETVGERGQILPISTRISGICKEKAARAC